MTMLLLVWVAALLAASMALTLYAQGRLDWEQATGGDERWNE